MTWRRKRSMIFEIQAREDCIFEDREKKASAFKKERDEHGDARVCTWSLLFGKKQVRWLKRGGQRVEKH